MPNWCQTDYQIYGSKKSIDKLSDLLDKTWETENKWLGHVVEELTGEECKICSRGFLSDAPNRVSDEQVDISCETAWSELNEWREFICGHFDDVCFGFLAIEPGCGVFISNMDEYLDKYLIDDVMSGEWDFYNEEDTIEYVNKHWDKCFDNIDDVITFAGTTDELFINPIEYAE